MCFYTKLKLSAPFLIVGSLFLASVGIGNARADEPKGIEISKKDCARIVAHKPAADVEYKPGVDAADRPVVPADLPGSAIIEAPEKIIIPLTLDVADLFSLPEGVAGEAGIGTIEYDIMSGRLEYNGQQLTDPQMAAISAACANMKE
ncbi:hypothetical protein [Nisaea nitritireducens]|uniref:hypothetical protein n=1 Tax=Nisaea nitritireducens TaxID=568392 RepID=UPI0018665D09|nr:hypothetical protein [Nisaea nitritireducens]